MRIKASRSRRFSQSRNTLVSSLDTVTCSPLDFILKVFMYIISSPATRLAVLSGPRLLDRDAKSGNSHSARGMTFRNGPLLIPELIIPSLPTTYLSHQENSTRYGSLLNLVAFSAAEDTSQARTIW